MKDQLLVLMAAMVQQKININFSKVNTKFCWSLHLYECWLYLNKTEICKFATKDNLSWYNFCLGSESNDFNKDEQSKTSINGIA